MILIKIKMQTGPRRWTSGWRWQAPTPDIDSKDRCLFFQFARSLTDDNEFVCIEGFKEPRRAPRMSSSPT